ncbi:putative NADH dehydrogenase [ubiquinone] iron-sulfur protein 6 [Schistosoma japonicum]|uniref:NADH dehydrogenase (Ubiquinone) Fe-S protein 10 n=1 Tax=Schistosoma japonicum TaxID=6182 RepID=Q5DC02_SCHJA|nr:SJCHGC04370 protein [Schistosoma japonicum]KAH8865875.1 putative NADH dehydrogenase [ubiquinone] iron-sulfur protein 6, mitochondrial [Schistosoma japonicum]TNN06044.1 putative NADH dehydrogenase [ubiquinone] iron-sulfur protein 6 [Schistosoma japonicum]CAX71476.1 NADH dehydrogenase (ubiquinone) Fe-S protein 6 [Schistosoma japonicum]CAX71477.1 NADH dehydrogenase (ubiquinone) Fe-S protein 6 [Schistosoma japonicum]
MGMALRSNKFWCFPAYVKYRLYNTESIAEVTHTGQTFSRNDPSVVRFALSKKLVNRQFAEKLISEVPPIASKEHVISCDGGSGALGHPKVYINLDQPGNHACGYCGLRFYLDNKGH